MRFVFLRIRHLKKCHMYIKKHRIKTEQYGVDGNVENARTATFISKRS